MTCEQLTLLPEARARRRDPDTSKAAAGKVAKTNDATIRTIAALVANADYWGMTRDEVAHALPGKRYNTVCGAVSRASKAGLIVPTPYRRDGDSGSRQIVYRKPGLQ